MIRHGLEQLKANGKKGVSMALVLCISAFFMAFAAAILYTAGVVTAQSTHRLEEERCYSGVILPYIPAEKSEVNR